MNADDQLDGLKRIRKVEAPPFLYTRIRGRIDALAEAPASVLWIRAFAGATLLVLTLNVGVFLTTTTNPTGDGVAVVVSTLQLAGNNNLYHE